MPVAQVNLVVLSGAGDDPAGQYGLASLTAAMLTEGAGSRSSLEIADDVCIYSTCSLEAEENDQVVDEVLHSRPDFERDDAARYVPPGAAMWVRDGVLRLTPESGADGFTAFALSPFASDFAG